MPAVNTNPIPELDYRVLTDVVNLTQRPGAWLKNTFFSQHETQTTDRIDIEVIRHGRQMAPLVARGSEALLVGGLSRTRESVGGAHIRIKQQFGASQLLFGNHVGGAVYRGAESQGQLIRRHIAEDLAYGSQQVDDREEWLCAQMLRGRIEYNEYNGESILIDAQRPPSLNLDLATNSWDIAGGNGPANADISGTESTVRQNMSQLDAFQPDTCILGREAEEAFRKAVVQQKLWDKAEDTGLRSRREYYAERDVSPHAAKLIAHFDGIDYWSYPRQIKNDEGVLEPLIRPKYAEYLATGRETRRVMYYGAIEDLMVFQGQVFVSERFSKSWTTPDPAAVWYLIESNPLPWCKVTTTQASVKVVSG